MTVSDQRESNVRYYSRLFPVVFSRGVGAELEDSSGAKFIDLFCGAGALNYGHNPERAKLALMDYILSNGITHSLDMATEAKESFMDVFAKVILSPRHMDYKFMFTGPTGTNAVEAALKLARLRTGRSSVVSFTSGFHGVSLGALAATASVQQRRAAGVTLCNIDRMPYDGFLGEVDTIAVIEKCFEDSFSGFELPAAFLVETIQVEGGINSASSRWLRALEGLARKFGALLIIDDIQTGCGRTGTFFSFDELGIVPDLICLSKSLSGYGLPLSLLLIKPEHDVWRPGDHSGTFRGNNHAFVTGRVCLQYWNDPSFLAQLRENVAILDVALNGLLEGSYPKLLGVKGRGLLRGVACESGVVAKRALTEAFRRGVLVETCGPDGSILKILPPLTIAPTLLKEAIGRIIEAIEKAST